MTIDFLPFLLRFKVSQCLIEQSKYLVWQKASSVLPQGFNYFNVINVNAGTRLELSDAITYLAHPIGLVPSLRPCIYDQNWFWGDTFKFLPVGK